MSKIEYVSRDEDADTITLHTEEGDQLYVRRGITVSIDTATTEDVVRFLIWLQDSEDVHTIDDAIQWMVKYGVDWDDVRDDAK